jgi:hypothetical protein
MGISDPFHVHVTDDLTKLLTLTAAANLDSVELDLDYFPGARSASVLQRYGGTRIQRRSTNSTCFILEKRRDCSSILSPGSMAQSSSQSTPWQSHAPAPSTTTFASYPSLLFYQTDMAIIDTFKANTTSVDVLPSRHPSFTGVPK